MLPHSHSHSNSHSDSDSHSTLTRSSFSTRSDRDALRPVGRVTASPFDYENEYENEREG